MLLCQLIWCALQAFMHRNSTKETSPTPGSDQLVEFLAGVTADHFVIECAERHFVSFVVTGFPLPVSSSKGITTRRQYSCTLQMRISSNLRTITWLISFIVCTEPFLSRLFGHCVDLRYSPAMLPTPLLQGGLCWWPVYHPRS